MNFLNGMPLHLTMKSNSGDNNNSKKMRCISFQILELQEQQFYIEIIIAIKKRTWKKTLILIFANTVGKSLLNACAGFSLKKLFQRKIGKRIKKLKKYAYHIKFLLPQNNKLKKKNIMQYIKGKNIDDIDHFTQT